MYGTPAPGYSPAGYASVPPGYPAGYGYPGYGAPPGYGAQPPSGYPGAPPGYPPQAAFPGACPPGYPPQGYAAGTPVPGAYGCYGGSYPSMPPGYGHPGAPPRDNGRSRRDDKRDRGGEKRDKEKEKEKEKEREAKPAPDGAADKAAEKPAAPEAAPGAAPVAGTPPGKPDGLSVTGCQHGTVGNIVRGEFSRQSENHGKPVYKKGVQVNNLDVMIYFWDDRDGPSFCGWWFGPKVGGDQVWAYHPDRSPAPPSSGWKVPYDGPVDETFKVEAKVAAKPDTAAEGKVEAKVEEGVEGPAPRPAAAEQSVAKEQSPVKEEAKPQMPVQETVDPEVLKKREEDNLKRQQLEEQKRRIEDMRRTVEEQQRLKAEEIRRTEEEQKRRFDEEAKRLQEEASRKVGTEDKRRLEQRAVLAIRRVIQKVRAGSPDALPSLEKELQDVLAAELDNTGAQRQRLKEESDKGLEVARARVAQINFVRQKDQEKKDEEDRKKRDEEERIRQLVRELAALVDGAERAANDLKETAAPYGDLSLDSVRDVERTAEAIENAGLEAKSSSKACTDFILQRGPEMKDAGPDIKQALAKLLQRINECSRAAEGAIAAARGQKNAAVRRASAKDRTKAIEALFEKYDKDRDKHLSKREVVAYSRGEHQFFLPDDILGKIWRSLVEEGQKGVSLEKFHLLKIKIGTEREIERDVRRREEREEKERELVEVKADHRERIKQATSAVDFADKDVSKAETRLQSSQQKARPVSGPDMLKLASEVDEFIKESKSAFSVARAQLDSLFEGVDEKFQQMLKDSSIQEVKSFESRLGRMEGRIQRMTNLAARFREQAVKKNAFEIDQLKSSALEVIRHNQRSKGVDREQLFASFDQNGDEEIDVDEFCDWFELADKDVSNGDGKGNFPKADLEAEPAEAGDEALPGGSPPPATSSAKHALSREGLERIFPTFLDEGRQTLTKEAFLRVTRLWNKVVKDTALTTALSVKEATTLRILHEKEVVEILEGPMREESSDVLRVRVKAMEDGAEGWATIVGNTGTTYLREGGGLFKVLKETILTEGFALFDATDATRRLKENTRKVKEGEVLEVYDWPKKEETSGLIRMRCKVRSDGAVGYVTTRGNQGAVFAAMI